MDKNYTITYKGNGKEKLKESKSLSKKGELGKEIC